MSTARLAIIGTFALASVNTGNTLPRNGHSNAPLTLCGITAGESTDSDVRRRYGTGYFVESEDHLGGRYFVDPAHRLTLHTTIGVDHLIFTVEVREGAHLPSPSRAALKKAECKSLRPPKALFGTIHLGDSIRAVRRTLGSPHDSRIEHGYRADHYDKPPSGNELEYSLTIRYRRQRLAGVEIYNGE